MNEGELNPIGIAEQAANSAAFEGFAPPIQVALFFGAMALLTSVLVSMTAFTRIVIVLSFVRRAMSTQEIPPNSVVIGLSLFLTMFVMGPTLQRLYNEAASPYLEETLSARDAFDQGAVIMREFMLRQTRKADLVLFIEMSDVGEVHSPSETPMRVLIPAFVVSELKTAFIMGFCIYIPFVLIDLVVSTVLMSLGMMMMPPVIISTPFKILLFVLVDGWLLIAKALTASFM